MADAEDHSPLDLLAIRDVPAPIPAAVVLPPVQIPQPTEPKGRRSTRLQVKSSTENAAISGKKRHRAVEKTPDPLTNAVDAAMQDLSRNPQPSPSSAPDFPTIPKETVQFFTRHRQTVPSSGNEITADAIKQLKGITAVHSVPPRWQSTVYHKGASYHLGWFANALDAARTYDYYILRFRGIPGLVRCNFPAEAMTYLGWDKGVPPEFVDGDPSVLKELQHGRESGRGIALPNTIMLPPPVAAVPRKHVEERFSPPVSEETHSSELPLTPTTLVVPPKTDTPPVLEDPLTDLLDRSSAIRRISSDNNAHLSVPFPDLQSSSDENTVYTSLNSSCV